jgi:hypothetical protein
MTRWRDADPDRDLEDKFEAAAQILETMPAVSAFPTTMLRGQPAVRPSLEQLIAFEHETESLRPGLKEAQIRHTFGLSAVRYFQYLNRAIDTAEALEADPVLINQLRARRAKRVELRAARQHATRRTP